MTQSRSSPESELVQRVAKALCDAEIAPGTWPCDVGHYTHMAQAAIEAFGFAQRPQEPVAWQWFWEERLEWVALSNSSEENLSRLRNEGYRLRPLFASSDASTQEPDEDHPDCVTARERELYFALMGLAGAVMSRRREWDNWMQGGIKIAPVVRKALRLNVSDTSTVRGGNNG